MSIKRDAVHDAVHELLSQELYRIILSSGGAKPTFSYLERELGKNVGTPAEAGVTRSMVARRTIGLMVASGDIAVDDNGRFRIA